MLYNTENVGFVAEKPKRTSYKEGYEQQTSYGIQIGVQGKFVKNM